MPFTTSPKIRKQAEMESYTYKVPPIDITRTSVLQQIIDQNQYWTAGGLPIIKQQIENWLATETQSIKNNQYPTNEKVLETCEMIKDSFYVIDTNPSISKKDILPCLAIDLLDIIYKQAMEIDRMNNVLKCLK